MQYPSELQINKKSFAVVYEKVSKSSCSVRIRKNTVHICLSRFVYGAGRDRIVKNFLKWAEKRLEQVQQDDFIEPVYENGGRIVTHNKIYEISVNFDQKKTARSKLVEGFLIEITLPANWPELKKNEKVKFLCEKNVMEDQFEYLKTTLDELNALFFRKEYGNCRYKRMNSRFGSCSNKRNINIAYRLLFAPREVFRYVCAHELAHLEQFNHSRKFWELVAEACPDYKESEKWLKHSGFMLG